MTEEGHFLLRGINEYNEELEFEFTRDKKIIDLRGNLLEHIDLTDIVHSASLHTLYLDYNFL